MMIEINLESPFWNNDHQLVSSFFHNSVMPMSSPARTLGSWVRIPLKSWMFVFILCLYR
jgi:hypothetical protein